MGDIGMAPRWTREEEDGGVLGLVRRLSKKFSPLVEGGGDSGVSAKWLARARKVSMEIVLARGQRLLSKEDGGTTRERDEEEVQAKLLAIKLSLARLEREERSGTLLADRPRGGSVTSPSGSRAGGLDALLAKSVVPLPVLKLLVLLSPHSRGGGGFRMDDDGAGLLEYDRDLGSILNGFMPAKAKGLLPLPRMIDETGGEGDKEDVGALGGPLEPLGGFSGKRGGASSFFLESQNRVHSELDATTSEEGDSPAFASSSTALSIIEAGEQGNIGGASYFQATASRLPVQGRGRRTQSGELPVVKAGGKGSSDQTVTGRSPGNGDEVLRGIAKMMEEGWLASEIELSQRQTFRTRHKVRGEPKTDIELVRYLLNILQGSLDFVPKLIQSRLCWADYVSTQNMCMEFVKTGVAHHNLKCLVHNLQYGAENARVDPITQAFARTMENVLLLIDVEAERLFAQGSDLVDKATCDKDATVGTSRACYSFASLSVSEFYELTILVRSQVTSLANLCGCLTAFEDIKKDPGILHNKWNRVTFPRGEELLDYLYNQCSCASGPEEQVVQRLFLNALEPFVQKIHECSFTHLQLPKEDFVDKYAELYLGDDGDETADHALGISVPSFLKDIAGKIRLSFFQYNILKEFDHCIPLLSFMEHLSKELKVHGKSRVTTALTLDARELERIRDHYTTISSVANSAIDGLLSFLSGKRAFQKIASQTASKAKVMSVEKSLAKAEEDSLIQSRRKRERQQELASEMKSAAAVYEAAKTAARSAEKEADRLRLVEESRRRSDMIQEASVILRDQAALRMKRVQKEIDRLEWRRRRIELQPKRLTFDGASPAKKERAGEDPSWPAAEDDPELDRALSPEPDHQEGAEVSGEIAEPRHSEPEVNEDVDESERGAAKELTLKEGGNAGDVSEPDQTSEVRNFSGNEMVGDKGVNGNGSLALQPSSKSNRRGEEDAVQLAPESRGDVEAEAVSHPAGFEEEHSVGHFEDDQSSGIFLDAPLEEAMHVCVVQRVDLHYSCISRLCVQYFLEELNLLEFFGALRKVYLLEAGNFGHSFLSHIIEKEVREEGLKSLFDLSVRISSSYRNPEDVETFYDSGLDVKMDDLLSGFLRSVNHNSALQWLDLERSGKKANGPSLFGVGSAISWPFSLVVSREMLAKYQLIFGHLFQFKYLERSLVHAWQDQQVLRRQRLDGSEGALRESLLCNVMLNFVKNYLSQIGLKLQGLSADFQRKMEGPGNICEINQQHQNFLDKCLDACFLRHQADAGARNLIQTALQSITELLKTDMKTQQFEVQLSRAERRFQNAYHSLKKIIEFL